MVLWARYPDVHRAVEELVFRGVEVDIIVFEMLVCGCTILWSWFSAHLLPVPGTLHKSTGCPFVEGKNGQVRECIDAWWGLGSCLGAYLPPTQHCVP